MIYFVQNYYNYTSKSNLNE